MFIPEITLPLFFAAVSASAPGDLTAGLRALPPPGPVAATLRLDLRLERTLHRKTASAETSVTVDVGQDEEGLRVRWSPSVLENVDAEARVADTQSERLAPMREAVKELDPARIAHLLNQVHTLLGLVGGTPVEDRMETYEGHEARRLVFKFEPRLSWTEQYYVRHKEGRLTLWVSTDGVPLASESKADYAGKTSRVWGRFEGSTIVRTRYAFEGSRLRVAERDSDETTSRDDGGEMQRTHLHFTLSGRPDEKGPGVIPGPVERPLLPIRER
jgi:hypothetical protein